MPNIAPFRAIHYPWGSDFSRLTAPPYDVISPQERDELEASHENNVINVTLGGDHSGRDEGKYEAAAALLGAWLASGVLVQDTEPQFFLLGMKYRSGSERRTTLGVLASLDLEEFGEGQIFPHERTIPGPIQDRLKLMRATQANLEPLWFFASSKIEGFLAVMEATVSQAPLAGVRDGAGVEHSVWAVAQEHTAQMVESLSSTPLVIADGHHRYETALAYREERRRKEGPGPWDQILALIVDPVDYPPLLKPIHRLAHGISVGQIAELAAEAYRDDGSDRSSSPTGGDHHPLAAETGPTGLAGANGRRRRGPEAASVPLEKVNAQLPEVVKLVEDAGPGTIGVVTSQGAWMMRTAGELDTVFLNDRILEPSGAEVRYEHDPQEVAAMLVDGVVAFILAPAPIELVASKALGGERMPPKTTLFWPKPRTGFVMRDAGSPRGFGQDFSLSATS